MRAFPLLALVLLSSCTLTIRPPAAPADPVPVLVVDYGRHSSLVLPAPDGRSVEYAYGEWEWFALANDAWYRVFPTLFWPTQGTLGRRFYVHPPDAPAVAAAIRAEARFVLRVEREKAAALQARLDRRFAAGAESKHANPLYGLNFVKDERNYCIMSDCNDVVEEWLKALGCDVSGLICSADFRVVD